MKKVILTLIFALVSTVSFAQFNRNHFHYRPNVDISQYEIIDSLSIERILIHFDKEIDDDKLISLGGGDYMAPVPHNDKMIFKTNSDRTKAIILYNSYCFGRHFEFNIEDNERRTIFWYEDKGIYCGYIYDKNYKICKYFESRKEFKRFMRRPVMR